MTEKSIAENFVSFSSGIFLTGVPVGRLMFHCIIIHFSPDVCGARTYRRRCCVVLCSSGSKSCGAFNPARGQCRNLDKFGSTRHFRRRVDVVLRASWLVAAIAVDSNMVQNNIQISPAVYCV